MSEVGKQKSTKVCKKAQYYLDREITVPLGKTVIDSMSLNACECMGGGIQMLLVW